MRYTYLLLLVGLLLAASPSADAQEDDGPVVYMTQHKVHPAKMDSLMTLIQEFSIPWQNFIAENVEGYWRTFSQHDTGNEYNLMISTGYPSWDMVDSVPVEELWPQFAATMDMTPQELGAKYMPALEWAYEGSEHMDQIWRVVASTGFNQSPETIGDAVVYMTQQKIKQARVDSLASLHAGIDIEWHNVIAEQMPGYERHYLRHDTGNEYNYMIVTTYPSWDMVDSMPENSEFAPQFMENMGMTQEEAQAAWAVQFEGYAWANEDIRHMDQIWRPISRPMNNMDEEMMGEEME
jgi:hypothetical protein